VSRMSPRPIERVQDQNLSWQDRFPDRGSKTRSQDQNLALTVLGAVEVGGTTRARGSRVPLLPIHA